MPRAPWVFLLPCAASIASLAACTSLSEPERTPLSVQDFAHPPAGIKTDTLELPPALLGLATDGEIAAAPSTDDAGQADPAQDRARARAARNTRGASAADAGKPRTVADASKPPARPFEPGQKWTVEGLVGQINGRPIFADGFLLPIEDEIRAIVAMPDRLEARRALVTLVSRRFKSTVDSELIVAEAESQLSPEQQQGVFAWLRSFQEETIAQRGGSRSAAEQSLESENSLSLEEFLQEKRDEALAGRLLNQRIEPRAIVSWRDVVQEYERRKAEFNPPASIKIGRIRLDPANDQATVAKVRELISQGKSFSDIARELKLAEGGFWNRYELPPAGIQGLDLSDAIKQRLVNLKVDQLSEPIESRGFISWLSVMEIESQKRRSIYDRDLQLALEQELKGRRRAIETDRYIDTLRSRWVTDDIGEMERKLIEIALQRYWR